MNKIDRDSAYNPKALRKAMAEIEVKPSLQGKDGQPTVELSRLARQTASRLSEESFSPTMIIGTLRLTEFALLSLTGFLVYALYVGMTWESTLLYYAPAIFSGSALAVLLIQVSDGYQKRAEDPTQGSHLLVCGIRTDRVGGVLHAIRPGIFTCVVRGLVRQRRGHACNRPQHRRLRHPPLGAQWRHGAPRRHSRRR